MASRSKASASSQTRPAKENNQKSVPKTRKRLTPEQHGELEIFFLKSPMPDTAARLQLSDSTGLDPKTVQVWFQNRRQKEKKMPTPERTHKNLPSVKAESKQEVTGKENIPPFLDQPYPSVLFRGSIGLQRTYSAPLASFDHAFQLEQRPVGNTTARPSLQRASSLRVFADSQLADSLPGQGEHDLIRRMPMEESSPVKAVVNFARPTAALRRTQSFTLEWAASQRQSMRPTVVEQAMKKALELSPTSERQSAMPRKRTRMPALTIDVSAAPAFQQNLDSGLSSPFIVTPNDSSCSQDDDQDPFVVAGASKFSGLLRVASAHLTESPSQSEASTDEEVSVAAKRREGDQTYSSLGSDDLQEASSSQKSPVGTKSAPDGPVAAQAHSECADWLLSLGCPQNTSS